MPRVSTIADVLKAEDGDIVHSFKCTVEKQWERKSGKTKEGPWSFENLEVRDRNGDQIKLVLKGRDPLGKARGKDLTIVAHKGTKGWSGVYAKDDEYKGKVTRVLQVTKTGEVIVGNDGDVGEDKDRRGDEDEDRTERRQRERKPDPEDDDDDEPKGRRQRGEDDDNGGKDNDDPEVKDKRAVIQAKHWLAQRANFMLLCLDATGYIVSAFNERTGQSLTKEMVQSITMSLFISGDRALKTGTMPSVALQEVAPCKPAELEKKEAK